MILNHYATGEPTVTADEIAQLILITSLRSRGRSLNTESLISLRIDLQRVPLSLPSCAGLSLASARLKNVKKITPVLQATLSTSCWHRYPKLTMGEQLTLCSYQDNWAQVKVGRASSEAASWGRTRARRIAWLYLVAG